MKNKEREIIERELFETIKSDIGKSDISQAMIAKKLGIKDASLTYYLQLTNRMKFIQFYRLVNIVYEDNYEMQIEMLKNFTHSTQKKENFKVCLEWSIHQGNNDLFDLAIQRVEESDKNLETAELYKLLMNRNKAKINGLELYNSVEGIKLKGITQKDMEVLARIITLYSFFDLKNFSSIALFAEDVFKRITDMKKGFMKIACEVRVKEISAVSYMKSGKIHEAETMAKSIIDEYDFNLFPLPINSMYSLLAELYLFRDQKKAGLLIDKAINMFRGLKIQSYKNRESTLKSTHDFIKIEIGDYQKLYLEDEAEKAHYFAKIEQKENALRILNQIEEKNGSLSAHQLYYKALATQKMEDFKKAKDEFHKRGDFYYSKLAEI